MTMSILWLTIVIHGLTHSYIIKKNGTIYTQAEWLINQLR